MAEVEEHFVPEARVEQVQHGVLGAADVEVNARRDLPLVKVQSFWFRAGWGTLNFEL